MAGRDGRLLAPSRWTAAAIVPVLLAASVILYLFPSRTEALWAWTIRPTMTAMTMGAGYLAGAWFFYRVVTTGRGHPVAPGFLGTTAFTGLLLLATLLHWDRFNHDHVSFWAWLALYVATPVLLPWLWVRNRATDPGRPDAGGVVPRPLRTAVGAAGAAQLAFAVAAVRAGGEFDGPRSQLWLYLGALVVTLGWLVALQVAERRAAGARVAPP